MGNNGCCVSVNAPKQPEPNKHRETNPQPINKSNSQPKHQNKSQ